MANVDKAALEQLVRQVLLERLGGAPATEAPPTHGVRAVAVPQLEVRETDRLDTGKAGDRVWTRDLFSLAEAPRLGCGLMVMEETTFPWKLTYDEMDYVVEGRLDVLVGGERISAGPGEVLHIPRGSEIQFSVKGKARFLYFVYPADWQK
ncbi:cupin domain-containing protein [Intestinimonas sp.]|uniref:cupin domain-containing protein n=1 Tax=Intestinimonas sp. TaxID=1965293 RepID=UPI00345BE477